jgi:hypothetical protein
VFLLIKDAAFPRCRESPLARLGHVFPQAIAAFAIADHRLALTSYLDQDDGITHRELSRFTAKLKLSPTESPIWCSGEPGGRQ